MTAKHNRRFVNRVPWVLRSRAHWKDLPAQYCNWRSVHQRFTRWGKSGLLERIFQVLPEDADNKYVIIDPTTVRAHQ